MEHEVEGSRPRGRNLSHLPPKVLFEKRQRKKIKGGVLAEVNMDNGHLNRCARLGCNQIRI